MESKHMESKDDMMLTWKQISCQKAVNGVNFSQGVQDFNFQLGRPYGWIPNQSYFRIGLTLAGAGGANAPVFTDDVALADNVCSSLYNNIYARAGGQDISSIVNYAPQAAQVKTRLGKSKAWLDGAGKGSFGCDPDFQSRQGRTTKVMPSVLGSEKSNILLGSSTATVAIGADGAVAGNGQTLLDSGETALNIGDQIMVKGMVFTVIAAATDPAGANCVVSPKPTAAIGATTDAFKLVPKKNGNGTNKIYLMWQPPVGIFNHASPLGSGDYRIQCNPNAYFQKSAVQSILSAQTEGTDFKLTVDDVQLYVATVMIDIPATGQEILRLKELQVQSKTLSSRKSNNLLDFSVPPSTYALSIFVQSQDAGSNTLVPATLFKCKDASDANLSSIQVSFAGQNKPDTRWTSEYVEGSTNYLVQRYTDTQLYSGMYWSEGGPESFEDWFQRGGLYHFSWHKDRNDRSTQAQINISFGGADGIEENANLLVCAHYTKVVEINTENGFVTNVSTLAT